eukprot:CAMPEP_0119474728 /NCGR_PEP_ID=MMETSP1344-20130328/5872_1 /TAXON_ID=236787 /ORGANISM="Florenciella parvula, Strain CCMP2471" /LENGTH=47 /DNA_ID= /DNA_START= /DNA_END= /DNA_ORIENTATION=
MPLAPLNSASSASRNRRFFASAAASPTASEGLVREAEFTPVVVATPG